MSVPVVYLPEAEDDIVTTFDAYESRRIGLGDEFMEALKEVADRIQDFPSRTGYFVAISVRRHCALPLGLYYRDRGSDILVIAVQHGRRSSRAWRGRI